MKDLTAKIQEIWNEFSKDATLQAEKGNKAAGMRARKASLSIDKMMKEFRKISVEEARK
ncbi:histone H1 [uncultured Duncaniella sp.]|uniref:histone H1 n=1 Tax=uncultured Duncaniella sp. TaxID=2768039 RepID=UPI0025A96E92|nr:histone H1 [uncultured Duncaniella sp.]